MELKINKITHTLKNFNSERRVFYIKNVLSHNEAISKADKKEKNKIIALQASSILDLVWMFIYPQDKKELKDKSLMKITVEDYIYFLKELNQKLIDYSNYLKHESPTQDGVKQDINQVYAFLANQLGWTFEHMREMDELELVKAIKEVVRIKKASQRDLINSNVISGLVVQGDKGAQRYRKDMNREAERDERFEDMKQGTPQKRNVKMLSPEELRRAVNGRRS